MKLKSKNGYNIECDEYIKETDEIVIIAMHDFGGDKSSNCIKKIKVNYKNFKYRDYYF